MTPVSDRARSEIDISFIMPVYGEQDHLKSAVFSIVEKVEPSWEIIIIFDHEEDLSVLVARALAAADPRVRPLRSTVGTGRGALNAIRTGFLEARGSAVVVTMADLCDDVSLVNEMWKRYLEGDDVVSASRYTKGGRVIGAPALKGTLSRVGGITLHRLTGLPTTDPTNAFKLWDAGYLRATSIESTGGFEYSLELCAKAFIAGRRMSEIPTTWRERPGGQSKFRLWQWLPRFIAWYVWLVVRVWARRLRLSR